MKRKASTEFEARALQELLGDREKRAFAQQHKLPGGESMLSQHMHGRRPVSMEAAVIYAEALGVTLERISPTWAALARRAAAVLQPQHSTGEANTLSVRQPPPPSYNPPWPFKRVSPDEWRSLSHDQQQLVEGTVRQFAAHQPNDARRAVA
jgi:hypothetical protein